jgi:prophage DNA circulation protein
MGLLDKIKDIFFKGPDSWDERLADTIDFTSPEGNRFSAKWRRGPRTLDKKLGVFDYPKVKGSIVQDLDTVSSRYDLNFFFDGKDNDIEANRFFAVCKERGTWGITHPVHGFFEMQLITVTEIDAPVDSGNITEITSVWIEPIDPDTLKTGRELFGFVDDRVNDLNVSALQEFANKVSQATETLKQGIRTATNGIENISEATLGPLASVVDSIDDAFRAIQDGIQDTLNATVLQVEALAGQIQGLIQTPLFASNDIGDRLNTYDDLTERFAETLPGGSESTTPSTATADERKNQIAVSEVSMVAGLGALGQIVTSGTLQTKAQTVEAAEQVLTTYNTILSSLEAQQDLFQDVLAPEQFFVQTESYVNALALLGSIFEYLQTVAFDLAVEKRFILDRPRAPIEIAITEYGGPGEDDANINLFYESNQLSGGDNLILPAGREVVVYL